MKIFENEGLIIYKGWDDESKSVLEEHIKLESPTKLLLIYGTTEQFRKLKVPMSKSNYFGLFQYNDIISNEWIIDRHINKNHIKEWSPVAGIAIGNISKLDKDMIDYFSDWDNGVH